MATPLADLLQPPCLIGVGTVSFKGGQSDLGNVKTILERPTRAQFGPAYAALIFPSIVEK